MHLKKKKSHFFYCYSGNVEPLNSHVEFLHWNSSIYITHLDTDILFIASVLINTGILVLFSNAIESMIRLHFSNFAQHHHQWDFPPLVGQFLLFSTCLFSLNLSLLSYEKMSLSSTKRLMYLIFMWKLPNKYFLAFWV